MALWSRLASFVTGGAVATAASEGVRPVLEPVRQHAWQRNQVRVLNAEVAAELRAQGLIDDAAAVEEASRSGIGSNRLEALVQMLLTTPGVAELERMHNRATIDPAQFNHALSKHRVEPQYWAALLELANARLSVADVAAAVQQGHVPNDGILPDVSAAVQPAQGAVTPIAPDQQPPSHVPLTQIDLDPIAEAAAEGYDLERLRIRANLAGLPPGPETLLAMWNRGEIDEASVDAGIREGHMKTKWAGAFKRMRWAVLSGQEYASAHLRAWITQEEMYAGGALTGHTKDQMDLLFLNRGRPASPTQMWRAWARGVIGPRGVPTEFEDHAKAIAISDIRPEYAELLWNIRFNYPTLFQLGRLVQSGAVTPTIAADWAHKTLYAPEVIAALTLYWQSIYPGGIAGAGTASKQETRSELADEYAGGYISQAEYQAALEQLGYSGAALTLELELADARRAKRYREKVIDAVHRAYLEHEIDATEASSDLATVNVLGGAAAQLVGLWDMERRYTHSRLTQSQVVKAHGKGLLSDADALARLADFGLSADDAAVRLAEG